MNIDAHKSRLAVEPPPQVKELQDQVQKLERQVEELKRRLPPEPASSKPEAKTHA